VAEAYPRAIRERPPPRVIDRRVRDHEAAHMGAAKVLGIELEPAEFDHAAWDGWTGRVRLTAAARERLTGSFEDRLAVAVIAIMPSVAILGGEEGSRSDDALVLEVCPRDWALSLWEFYVRRRAQELMASAEFGQAFGKAIAEIEGSSRRFESGASESPLASTSEYAGSQRLRNISSSADVFLVWMTQCGFLRTYAQLPKQGRRAD
jgi:hypothetical protein